MNFFLFLIALLFSGPMFAVTEKDIADSLLPEAESAGHMIVKRLQAPENVAGNRYGRKFPQSWDYLLPVLQQAKGKRVLEIAGASGEVASLFVLAGAQTVFLNDIVQEELDIYTAQVSPHLPKKLRKNLHLRPGDIFDLLHKRVFGEEPFDIIIARNFFHFLSDARRTVFLDAVQRHLAPGGLVYLSVHYDDSPTITRSPRTTRWLCERFLICGEDGQPYLEGRGTFRESDEDGTPLDFIQKPLLRKNLDGRIQVQSPELGEKIHTPAAVFWKEKAPFIKTLPGVVMLGYYKSVMRFYSPPALAALFLDERFEIVKHGFINMSTGQESTELPENPGSSIIVRKK